eukprot:3763383-Pyramimonas_sp.AAC.1
MAYKVWGAGAEEEKGGRSGKMRRGSGWPSPRKAPRAHTAAPGSRGGRFRRATRPMPRPTTTRKCSGRRTQDRGHPGHECPCPSRPSSAAGLPSEGGWSRL